MRLKLLILVLIVTLVSFTLQQGQTPTFWNKISLTPTNINLYYGWSSNGERIFFRFRGINQGYLALVLGSTLINSDMIVVRQPSSSAIVEDRYSIDSTLSNIDTVSNVQYESGGYLVTTGEWDITVSRLGNTLDTTQDRAISTSTMTIMFFVGTEQTFTNRNVSVYTYANIVFAKTQICDTTCSTCSGPEPNNCLSCLLTREFFLNSCVPKVPTYWNRLIDSTTNAGFKIDYSIDVNLRFIYFRLRGTNNGWVGLGFHNQMPGADIILINRVNSQIFAWDKYASGYAAPANDTQNDVRYISGTRNSSGYWDTIIVRPMRAQQTTFDRSISLNSTNNFLLAFASSDNDTQKHNFREVFVQYITNVQICDSTCLNCTGPDPDQCIACQSQYFKDSNGLCVICFQGCATCTGGLANQCQSCVAPYFFHQNQCILCHSSCKTCTGTANNQCLSCSNSSNIVIDGFCVSSLPVFWNNLTVRTNFTLFYGFDTNTNTPTYIYFKIRGIHQGWLGLGFGATNISGDIIRLRRVGSSIEVVDSQMSSSQLSTDPINNCFYIRGNRDAAFFWDVDFVRKINSGDPLDIIISTNSQTITRVLFGNSDTFSNDFTIVELANIVFNTSQIQNCHSSCKNCIGQASTDCSACYDGQYLDTGSCRDCSVMCLTCNGPTSINCLSCRAEFSLEGSQCISIDISTCHSSCQTCNGTTLTSCLTCKTGYTRYTQNGQNYCLKQTSDFWNYIQKTDTIRVYYGFDLNNTDFIYFKITGQNEGWIGIGFGHAMAGMDTVMIYVKNNSVVVTDRYSSGYTEPEIDASNDVFLLSGTRDSSGNWDAVFVKKMRTQDPFDTTLEQLKSYPMSVAISNTDETNVRHISRYIVPSLQLVNQQVCDSKCGSLGCSGPETEDCKIYSTVARGGLSSVDYYIYSPKLLQALVLSLILIISIYI